MRKGGKGWRKGWKKGEEYEKRNGRWRRKMEGRVRRTIEEWKEMVVKRRDKMKEVAGRSRRRVRG